MSSLHLQHFETFMAVAEQGSFTLAAQQLRVSKAAVSKSVHLLEDAFRFSLFIRTTRKVSLTEEGKLLLEQCERLKIELDATKQLVAGLNASPTGVLRISCSPYFTETHLSGLLKTYLNHFPEVVVEVFSEERMPDMEREQIDIVFGINWPAPLDVVARVIGKTRYVLCASPAYLEAFGIPKNIKDLEGHRYIPHLGRASENIIADLKHKTTLKLSTPLKFNTTHLMKKAALDGWGIVQLHDYVVEQELASGTLIEILRHELNQEIPLYVYYQKHRFVQPKIKQFIELIPSPY